MDTDQKTLADLSHEAKEKKYVTLEVGSKISGYTKEYLDRLCRLDKIEHGVWEKGGFVLELNSLLRETHTLLISDEEINFVDKRELVPSRADDVAFPTTPPVLEKKVGDEIAAVPILAESAPRKPAPVPMITSTPTSPPIATSPPALIPPLTPPPPIAYGDEWDALLFGSVDDTTKKSQEVAASSPSLYQMPSEFRPIRTSVDPLPHRDPAPLFPFSPEKALMERNTPAEPVVASFADKKIDASISSRTDVTMVPAIATTMFPRVREERHLTVPEPHSLTKGITLSASVAFLAVSSGALLYSMLFPDVTKIVLAGAPKLSVVNVASVRFAFPQIGTMFYESHTVYTRSK